MLNSIILLGGLVYAFGLGAISPNQEKQDNTQFKLENHKSVSYNDEEYTITFSADELNNYHWDNLADEVNELNQSSLGTLNGVNVSSGVNQGGVQYYFFNINSGTIICILDETFVFAQFLSSDVGTLIPFENDLVYTINNSYYSRIKSAIELDIQANQPSDNIPQVMSDFISVLISGISQLAGGLANGIVAMASALFLSTSEGQVTGLSLFGGIIAIFAGLALAIGITTKVYTWVTSLGN